MRLATSVFSAATSCLRPSSALLAAICKFLPEEVVAGASGPISSSSPEDDEEEESDLDSDSEEIKRLFLRRRPMSSSSRDIAAFFLSLGAIETDELRVNVNWSHVRVVKT
eukprot:jgi/Mesvir1/5896/Mv00668-RA.1